MLTLHRIVIFRDGPERAGQVEPCTTTHPMGAIDPRKLWGWLQNYLDKTGGDVAAFPHNGNLSSGMMFVLQVGFADGTPLDAHYAAPRQKWERLYEATPTKGEGEAHYLFSPDYEPADFETANYGSLDATQAKIDGMLAGEYPRSGLQRGLMLEEALSVNLFKFGMGGAGNDHISMSSPENDSFIEKKAPYEPSEHRVVNEESELIAL